MAKPTISDDQIREAAYHLWIADGQPQGKDLEYWFQAETKLAKPAPRKRAAAKKPAAKKPAAKAAATAKPKATKKPAAKA